MAMFYNFVNTAKMRFVLRNQTQNIEKLQYYRRSASQNEPKTINAKAQDQPQTQDDSKPKPDDTSPKVIYKFY